MVHMSLSAITLIGSAIEVLLPMMVEVNVVGYVPPQAGMGWEAELVPVLPKLRIRTVL